jgi:hypothetical protein
MSLLDQAALAYLGLPVLIFLVGWLNWWAGLPMAAILLAVLRPVFGLRSGVRVGLSPAAVVTVLLVAVVWSSLGGAGHLFFANFDWYTRDAVMRDLVVGNWPVAYERADASAVLLRAPIAYYLPAALVGKVFGVSSADPALLAWTSVGVALFLAMAVSGLRSLGQVLTVLAVLVFFSGMDLVGTVLRGGLALAANLTPVDHLEWWAQRYQFSSHTTQLFWVPNHALPGWLATLLLLRNHDKTEFMRILPVVVALIPLWSPLTALGFLPFALVAFSGHVWSQGPRAWKTGTPPIAAIGIVGITGLYLTAGSSAISSGATRAAGEPWWFYFPHYLQFVLLEAGVLWFLLIIARRDAFLWTAGAVLLVLPALWFGPSNDLAMRGSIPALLILACAAADVMRSPALARQRRIFWPILAVLLLGVPTAATEMIRAVREPVWKPDLTSNLIEKTGGFPPHYVVDSDSRWLSRVMIPDDKIFSSAPGTSAIHQETK